MTTDATGATARLTGRRLRPLRRGALGVAAIGVLVICTGAGPAAEGSATAIRTTASGSLYGPPPFSASSAFNRRLPRRPTVATNGQGLATVTRSVNYREFTPIVYTSTASGVPYTIRLKMYGEWGKNPLHGKVVRLPARAAGGVDGDGHMTIVIPSEDRVVSLYQAEPAPRSDGTWWATWGGTAALSGDGANFADSSGGRESGVSQLAGLITPGDVRRGIAAGPNGDLGHALAVGYPLTNDTIFVRPAQIPGGGNSSAPEALYMGQKIFLRPKLDLRKIDWTVPGVTTPKSIRFSRLVARTLQRYGAVVLTNSPALSFQLVHPNSWTNLGRKNPWPALIGPAAGGYYGFTVRKIPGKALRALAPDATETRPLPR